MTDEWGQEPWIFVEYIICAKITVGTGWLLLMISHLSYWDIKSREIELCSAQDQEKLLPRGTWADLLEKEILNSSDRWSMFRHDHTYKKATKTEWAKCDRSLCLVSVRLCIVENVSGLCIKWSSTINIFTVGVSK